MEQVVLVVDDNKPMLELARMEWNKYHVDLHDVKTVGEAVSELQKREYVLVAMEADHLKDALLGGIRTVRSVSALPILVLTSYYRPEIQTAAIRAGADLYITIPGTIPEGVMIGVGLVRRHLEFNRMTPLPPIMLEHSGLLLCVDYHKAFVQGVEVKLTPFEYNLLRLLLENKYRVLSYNQIFYRLWGDEYTGSPPRLVINLVSKLRSRLRVSPNIPDYIQNIRRMGYKFDPR